MILTPQEFADAFPEISIRSGFRLRIRSKVNDVFLIEYIIHGIKYPSRIHQQYTGWIRRDYPGLLEQYEAANPK